MLILRRTMDIDELKAKIEAICPEMLSHGGFIEYARRKYCEPSPDRIAEPPALADAEREAWGRLRDLMHVATVGRLIEHLRKNFRPEDRLCYMDCVEGLRNDCRYVRKDQLGERFFYYVGKLKDRRGAHAGSDDNAYPYVDDEDVVVA